jgi:hypothetical protein
VSTFLLIVSPRRRDLYVELMRRFAADQRVRIVLNRRVRDRRTPQPLRAPYRGERRRRERRVNHPIQDHVAFLGYTLVRLTEG